MKILPLKITSSRGLTLIEMLIVVTIIALLVTVLSIVAISQLSKSRDAERKSDLQKIKNSFEDYYDDNGRYPEDETVLSNCDGQFGKYLKEIPCDPVDNTPYIYDPSSDYSTYRVLAKLENTEDTIIRELVCHGPQGCGYPNQPTYNYGVAQGRRVSDTDDTEEPPEESVCTSIQYFTCEESNNPPTCQACGDDGCGEGQSQYNCYAECVGESACSR